MEITETLLEENPLLETLGYVEGMVLESIDQIDADEVDGDDVEESAEVEGEWYELTEEDLDENPCLVDEGFEAGDLIADYSLVEDEEEIEDEEGGVVQHIDNTTITITDSIIYL